jgi:hypothetical protein
MSLVIRTFAVGCASALAIAACNGKSFVGCAADKPEDSLTGVNGLNGVVPDEPANEATKPVGQLSCNGPQDNPCPATHYCQSLTCGGPGQCLPRPESCGALNLQVCGCDWKTYRGACDAHRAGVEVFSNTACTEMPFLPSPITPAPKPTVYPNEPKTPDPIRS